MGLLTLPLSRAIGPIRLHVYGISDAGALWSIYRLFAPDLYKGWALRSGCQLINGCDAILGLYALSSNFGKAVLS